MNVDSRFLAVRTSLITLALATSFCAGCVNDLDDEPFDGPEIDAAASVESALRTNSDPERLVVYSNNIENMIFDWKDLVHQMEEAPLRPDIFLVQQVSGKADLDRLIAFMNRRLGVDYDGIVAQDNPDDDRFGGEIHPRPKVTTGVIFRSSRFDIVSHDSWMPFGRGFKNQPKTCDERSNNSGYETLRVKLHDNVADENVVVVSLRDWTWHACTAKNMKSIIEGEDTGGPNDHARLGTQSALHIIGGDFNDRIFDGAGHYQCWYRKMNGALGAGSCSDDGDWGFTDPLYSACDGDTACVKRQAGIDSLFVRRKDGHAARADHFNVVSFAEGHRASVDATGGDAVSNTEARDGYRDVADRYSGHRARAAYVYYSGGQVR